MAAFLGDHVLCQYFLDLREVNSDFIDFQSLPVVIDFAHFTCDTKSLLFKPAVVDDSNLLTPVECGKNVFCLLIHSDTSESVPVMPGHIGIYLTIIFKMHIGNGIAIENTSVKKVTVKAGQTASVTFSNTKLGRVKLVKVMPDGGPLGGWVFDVYRKSDGSLVGTFTSG